MLMTKNTRNPMGESQKRALRVSFDGRLKLQFHGSKMTSDAGLLAYRELDEALGLTSLADDLLKDCRAGKNTRHTMVAAEMGANYPEFRGIICQCRNFYLGIPECTPYIDEKDVRSIARRKQAYAFATGPGDMNHDSIVESLPVWKTYRIESTVIENEIHGHTTASAKTLKEALEWATAHSKPPQNSDPSSSDL